MKVNPKFLKDLSYFRRFSLPGLGFELGFVAFGAGFGGVSFVLLIGWYLGFLFTVRFFSKRDSISVQGRGSDGQEEDEQVAAFGFSESGLNGGEVRNAGPERHWELEQDLVVLLERKSKAPCYLPQWIHETIQKVIDMLDVRETEVNAAAVQNEGDERNPKAPTPMDI